MDEAEIALQCFFDPNGPVSEDMRQSYVEAFEIRYKTSAVSDRKKFYTYLTQIGDASILKLLKKHATQSVTTHSNEQNTKGKQGPVRKPNNAADSSLISEKENVPKNTIFSPTLKYSLIKEHTMDLKRKYPRSTTFKFKNILNPSLCTNSCEDSLVRQFLKVSIESPEHLASFKNYVIPKATTDDLIECIRRHSFFLADKLRCRYPELPLITGRLVADGEGLINEHSVLMEFIRSDNIIESDPMPLLLTHLKAFDIYPGQTVGVLGEVRTTIGNAKVFPKELVVGIDAPSDLVSLDKLQAISAQMGNQPIRILAATGPFCPSTCFDTTILDIFIKHLENNPPHILILMGPFVDIRNKLVAAGDPTVLLETEEKYNDLYKLTLERIISNPILEDSTYVIIVPSVYDVAHPFPLPQPPLDISYVFEKETLSPNIVLASNPSSITIQNLLKVSITSADPVGPLLSSMLLKGKPLSARPVVAHQMLLNQRALFPLHPQDSPIDPLHFCEPPCVWTSDEEIPHLVIYCSDRLPPSARIVENRVFLNTGRLSSSGNWSPTVSQLYLTFRCPDIKNSSQEFVRLELEKSIRIDIGKLEPQE